MKKLSYRDSLVKFSKVAVGEQTIIIIMSVIVGLLSGFANILFRSLLTLVHKVVFVGGSVLLHIDKGGLYTAP